MGSDTFKGKHVLVTGTSQGLGRALAEVFLRRGATVYGCSRKPSDSLTEAGDFRFAQVDLASAEAPETMRRLLAKADRIDLAILNAGILGTIKDLRDTGLDELKHILEVNLWANKWLIDLFVEGGRPCDTVIGISSGASRHAYRGWGGYCISKAALNMLLTAYAKELTGTRFLALAPGLVDTAMQDYLTNLKEDGKVDEAVRKLKAAKGTDAMPSPEVVAARIIALLPKLRELPSGGFADVRDYD